MESVMTSGKSLAQGGNGKAQDSGSKPSDHERQQETSKAAKTALAAQRKAKELAEAASATGDPEERQKLLNEALEKEIEAESFGKTAKYLQSGSFQGMLAGGGIGTGIGVGLGTLTGMLVGGVATLATGTLGSAVGAGVGALKGPFVKPGEIAGEGVRKITGTVPGWEATEQQQKTLEKMVGQAHEQERPSEEDLTTLSRGKAAGSRAPTDGRQKKQISSASRANGSRKSSPQATRSTRPRADQKAAPQDHSTSSNNNSLSGKGRRKPRKLLRENKGSASSLSTDPPKKKPRKLEIRS